MAVDLFRQMDQLFRGEEIEGDLNTFALHRFLASDPNFSQAAKQIGNNIRDDRLAVGVWKFSLPRLRKSPWFKYPAPKKTPEVEALVKKIADVENVTCVAAEEFVMVLDALKVKDAAFAHYGIDASAK